MDVRCHFFLTRAPRATFAATIMCGLGLSAFYGTMFRGSTLSIRMFDEVFHFQLKHIEAMQNLPIILMVGSVCMIAFGIMLLHLSYLTNDAIRLDIRRTWRIRVSRKVIYTISVIITYILTFIWIALLACLVITTFLFTVIWKLCSKPKVVNLSTCIDFTQFNFMFPSSAKQEDMRICEAYKLKLFCKDYVEQARVMFIWAMVSCVLVILSLVHYLMCLSANYTHIRDHNKFIKRTAGAALYQASLHAVKDQAPRSAPDLSSLEATTKT